MLLIPALLAAIKSLSLSPIAIDLSNEKLYLLIAFLYNPGLGFLHSQLSNGFSEKDGWCGQ